MIENLQLAIGLIIFLGISGQWLAWKLRLPSILILLLLGFIVGPVTGLLNPDTVMGDLLFPLVSLSVAIILFEGGLSLKIDELREIGIVVRRLITIGALVTWATSTAAAYFILNFDLPLSFLLGAILVVTGPTVVIPLLRHIRPAERVGFVLKWEGILIDPVGATLAVLVFGVIVTGRTIGALPGVILVGMIETILVGGISGALGAIVLLLLFRRYWIPDYLQNPLSLMMVTVSFVIANLFQEEAGLLTVTVMGIILANQKTINIKGILEFKENLVMLALSSVFILLAAPLKLSDLSQVGINALIFLGALIFVVRPLAALVSTWGSPLNRNERIFIAWLAPRGIVAAAVSAVFAEELSHINYPQAESLVPVMFIVIVGTVVIYGLTGSWVARKLEVSQADPQGILMIGAHRWAREIAVSLQKAGCQVILVDSNWENIREARMLGLVTYYGSALSEGILDEIPLSGIGRIVALTPNDEVNALAIMHFAELFESAERYQIAPHAKTTRQTLSTELQGRILFGQEISFEYLSGRFERGSTLKAIRLTEKFNYQNFKALYGETAVPMFVIDSTRKIRIFTIDNAMKPLPGETLISLVDANHAHIESEQSR